MRHLGFSALFIMLMLACHPPRQQTDLLEAPDSKGSPNLLGLEPPYRWDEIKDLTQASISTPWSDSYWPYKERGLAYRWINKKSIEFEKTQENFLATVVEQVQNLQINKDQDQIALLSTAEKYDLLNGTPQKLPARISNNLEEFKLDAQRTTIELSNIWNPKIEDADKRLKEHNGLIDQLYSQYFEATAAKEKALAANDTAEIKRLEAEVERVEAELSKLWKSFEAIAAELTQANQAKKLGESELRKREKSLANSLKNYLPMTASSWETWNYWEMSGIENYTWMGHCHGWATASLIKQRPLHAVMAEKNGSQVLFTEGDIRALLTKVWADQAPGNFISARRCESQELPTNKYGRIVDGQLCYKGTNCAEKSTDHQEIFVINNRIERGLIEFRESEGPAPSKFAHVRRNLGRDQYEVIIFQSAQDLQNWTQNSNQDLPAGASSATLHLTLGCRDANPMTLHLALTQLLGQKKQGFIFDRTRTSEVWNHPVFAYKVEYQALKLTNQSESTPGEPVAITAIDDPLKNFRAPGTAFLVVAKTLVKYGAESTPAVSYKADASDDAVHEVELTYTLELDSQLNLIGGEWGSIPEKDSEDWTSRSDGPDFIWYHSPDAKPKTGLIDASAIDKIHRCSLEAATQTYSIKLYNAKTDREEDVEIPYSSCTL